MRLETFVLKHWVGLLALAVLARLPKTKKGWTLTTACGVSAAVIEAALGLPDSVKVADVPSALRSAAAMVRRAAVHDDAFLFVQVHIGGRTGAVPGTVGTLGHTFVVCVHAGRVLVFNTFVRNRAFEGLTLKQCEPERPRDPAEVAGALLLLACVYTDTAAGAPLTRESQARYSAAVAAIVSTEGVPRTFLQSERLTGCKVGVCTRTSDELVAALRAFAERVPFSREDEWIQPARDAPPTTSAAFLDVAIPDYERRVQALRVALRHLRRLE